MRARWPRRGRAWACLLFWASAGGEDPPPDPKLVMSSKTGAAAKVRVWHDVAVSCKGQAFKDCRAERHHCNPNTEWEQAAKALVACGGGPESCMEWDGCGFSGGSCDPRIPWGHVTKNAAFVCEPKNGPDLAKPCDWKEHVPAGPYDVVVVLTQPQWGAYYHFVIDSLSRVMWVHDQYPDVMKDPNTYFHTGMVETVGQDWARLVGIQTSPGEGNRLLEGWVAAKKVYFPPANACANNRKGAELFAIKGMHTMIQQALGSAEDAQSDETPVVMIIRRQKTSARRVTNHNEVERMVRELLVGWTVEVFSDHPSTPSVLDTCRMFSRANIIMGPHGAGFSNLICAQKGAPLIEFQQATHSWDFQLLAMKLGLPYLHIRTKMGHYDQGKVDVDLLRTQVQKAKEIVDERRASRGITLAPATLPPSTTTLPAATTAQTDTPATFAPSPPTVPQSALVPSPVALPTATIKQADMTATIEPEADMEQPEEDERVDLAPTGRPAAAPRTTTPAAPSPQADAFDSVHLSFFAAGAFLGAAVASCACLCLGRGRPDSEAEARGPKRRRTHGPAPTVMGPSSDGRAAAHWADDSDSESNLL